MSGYEGTCPLTQRQLIDDYFMEHRTKILDIAAFLDRMDRSIERNADDDFRIVAFREALQILASQAPGRVEQVQMLLSDLVTELLAERDQQNAFGASGRSR
ncbi:MAG: hypothetical protein M3Q08_08765 [Pseudomonadota bacterium]|nr:hypothetical protein [Chloroflexota bacterium]MDP9414171.1 hypothetical protein [Pseudomonadota bacterium]